MKQLNLNSVTDLIGDNKEVIVYGFSDCAYTKLHIDLVNHGYNLSRTDLIGNETIDLPFIRYKTLLTHIVAENYKRSLNNEPFIYLLFCVSYKAEGSEKDINLYKLAHSHNNTIFPRSITDTELRRCYRLYSEATSDIKNIIEQTIKFVRINVDKKTQDYSVEQIPPFWSDKSWMELWRARKEASRNKELRPTDAIKKEPNKIDKVDWRLSFWQKINEADALKNKHAEQISQSATLLSQCSLI